MKGNMPPYLMNIVAVHVCLLGLAAATAAHPLSVHHDLSVTLHPPDQRLTGVDTLTLEAHAGTEVLITLADDAHIIGVSIGKKSVAYRFKDGRLRIPLSGDAAKGDIKLVVSYECFFRDRVPEDPVYTEDPSYGVTGVISPEGTFLLAEAKWYPDFPDSKPTFRVRVQAPSGYEAVTAGKRLDRSTQGGMTTSIWEISRPSAGLGLSAGPYVVREGDHHGIPIYTYFFPEDDHLAKQYLEATAEYLRLYTDLFGPYPFEKFAVVENFFPTGYGFPSYTLLGRTVLRLPFILETSLAHEVAHAWWGSGVLVNYDQGNWCEGLVTYIADHLLKERSSGEEARAYRLRALRGYATLVSSKTDFPLQAFTSRFSPATHAVGYGKGAMVFHMARRLLGDEAFWASLREVFQEKLFQRASWDDFALAFERASGRNLGPFFQQWVARPGAPALALQDVEASEGKEGWTITGRVVQQAPYYDLEVPLRLELDGPAIDAKIALTGQAAAFTLRSKSPPSRIVVDPDVDLFRRLDPGEIPPDINGIKGSRALVAVVARSLSKESAEASKILLEAFGQKHAPVLREDEATPAQLNGHDVLYLGLPGEETFVSSLPGAVTISRNHFIVEGVKYDTQGDVLFIVVSHPQETQRVAGLFLPLSAKAIATAARKIPHYGKYSYLVFRDGVNQAKGTWPVSESPLIHVFKLKERRTTSAASPRSCPGPGCKCLAVGYRQIFADGKSGLRPLWFPSVKALAGEPTRF
jgi:hypothetical protein